MQLRDDRLARNPLILIQIGGSTRPGKIDSVVSTERVEAPSAVEPAGDRDEAAKAAQRARLDEVRKKGIYAWVQEHRFEKLKAQIRVQVIAANPGATPATIENEVARLVRDAMELALKAEAAKAAKRGEPPKPMIIDITV